MNLVLLARRADLLEATAAALRTQHSVEVRTLALDLADRDLAEKLRGVTASLDVGVAVYNAAYAPVGVFAQQPPEALDAVVDVNVRGPMTFARTLLPPMIARGRGALVLMSSLAGFQGTPRLTSYAASKAFNTVLAEGLWAELRGCGIDVVAACAGAIRTPGYAATAKREAPGTLDAEDVAERTLLALSRGPLVIPGFINKLAAWIIGRIAPRRLSIAVMGANTKDLA